MDDWIQLFLPGAELLDTDITDVETPLYEHFKCVADKHQSLLRIDKFLADRVAYVSRNRIQLAAQAQCVKVNGNPVKANYKVKPDDVVSIVMQRPPYETEIIPENIPINVVYEDDDLLVINKKSGIVVHPGCGNYTGTLVNALAFHLRDTPGFDPNDPNVGLVHRIDKDTSGLLVVAKNPYAKTCLGEQFFLKKTQRNYVAVVWGTPKNNTGTIQTNLGRDPHDRTNMTVLDDPTIGKNAVTHYKVLQNIGFVSVVECTLETGRTHQIRVHMKYIGHPVFNDQRYGGNQILKGLPTNNYRQFVNNCFDLCPRQALHAKTLGFVHPTSKQPMFFDTNLPDDMQQLIEKWSNFAQNSTIYTH